MSSQIYNNVTDSLAESVGSSDTVISVNDGSKFTDPGDGNYTPCYLTRVSDSAFEIVHITDVSGNNLTVTRSREGTDPLTFNAGDEVQVRPTRQSLAELDASGMSATTSTGAGQSLNEALDDRQLWVFDLSGLKGLEIPLLEPSAAAIIARTGRAGSWWWDDADHSASGTGLVASDPNEIAIAAPSSDASGASGAWRRSDISNVTPEMAGAIGDGVADDTQPCQAWMDWLIQNNVKVNRPNGKYLVTQIDVDGADNLVISGGHWKMKHEILGSSHHIFNVQNSNGFFTANAIKEGTSASSATHDSTEVFGGMIVQSSSFCGSFYCEYKNFTSWGVRANQLNGGTETEGLLVFGCRFLDFPLDTATVQQCGVLLGEDGEYSRVANCWFYRIPSAARFVDAANSAFKDNIVMDLNGEAVNSNAGAFYSEFTSPGNGNKIQVTGNKFNHIETGQYIVVMKGDPSKPQNESIVSENEVIVSGLSGTNNRLIVLADCPGSKVINNNLRSAGVESLHGLIRLNRCDGAIVDGNSLRSGDYAIELQDSSNVYIGDKNTYNGQASGKLLLLSSTVRITSNRILVFRISSAGALGFGDTDGISVVRNSAGDYSITHNFGDPDYGVFVMADNVSPAPTRNYSVVRSANSFDLSVTNSAGSSIDENVLLFVTLSHSNTHII